ncbi:MAG: Asp-tRNA(Asn)/Glu-tRNA(Gln) amidotransferase subunit GatB [Chitinophagaceae bacterium]|nr:MAG: Asp-tRNA(Asn)/Glu-tRNA(Gln) amidotransferase subunit GatB [Chitinophagaceae bacterium]
MKNLDKYEVVIGLEVHAQLLTKSKLFSGDSIAFGAEANTQVSPVSLAHPGTLPVMNKEVIDLAVRLGIALNCTITSHNYFARKNYFYPDLPKGYQVSQHTAPICQQGFLEIKNGETLKKILLNRIHMEEDAGKSIHDLEEDYTCVDLNRAGTPLLEIVTEPCLSSSTEAFLFLTELRKLVRWINVCDGNMEEGSMRCDANISIRLKGETKLGTRVEVKNLNSIRNVKKAIEFETERLISIVEKGETILQQTRSFNADNGTTFALRSKEEADDYRYFPEPDLPPFYISDKHIQSIKENMPLLPAAMEQHFKETYGLSDYDAAVICSDKEDAEFYAALTNDNNHYKAAANWFLGPLKAFSNEHGTALSKFPLTAAELAELIRFTETGKVSFQVASTRLLSHMISKGYDDPQAIAEKLNLLQESDEAAVAAWVKETLTAMPDKVKEYQSGKKALLGMFAGQVKKISKGKADMQLVNKILEQQLNKV